MLDEIDDSLPQLEEVNKLERKVKRKRKLSKITDDLLQKVQDSQDPIETIKGDSKLRALAAAAAREAAKRTVGMRPYDVQVVGGLELAGNAKASNVLGLKKDMKGNIVEMRTGEGKTLTATIPLYIGSLLDKGAWLITVNDYLSRRDAEWMGPVYAELDRTVGVLAPRNKEKLHPSYVYEADESYIDLVQQIRDTLSNHDNDSSEEPLWISKEDDPLKRGFFSDKGLEKLVEEEIVTNEAIIALRYISNAEDVLTKMEFEAPTITEVTSAGSKRVVNLTREKFKEKILEENPLLKGLVEGQHYITDSKLRRTTFTSEGIDLLDENGLITSPKDKNLTPFWSQAHNIAWAIEHDLLYEDMPHLRLATRKEAYDADITYSPSHEVVFDWMRDNLAKRKEDQVQRDELPGLILLDEVDYILIDDARTPHIITGQIKSPYQFYERFFYVEDRELRSHLDDFEKYEMKLSDLREDIEKSQAVRDWLIKELLPLRDIVEGKTKASESKRKKTAQKLEDSLTNLGDGHPFIEFFNKFEEGVHYNRLTERTDLKHSYSLSDEGYQFLFEHEVIKHPFNVDGMDETKDAMGLGKVYHFFNPTEVPMSYIDKTHHFVFNPADKQLWLTELGEETLKQKGILPPDDIVFKCGEVSTLIAEELLPLKHSEKKKAGKRLESILGDTDPQLKDAFSQLLEGLHYHKKPSADGREDYFELTETGYMHLFSHGAIPHPSGDADSVSIKRGAVNLLRAMHVLKEYEDYTLIPDEEGKPKVILVDKHSGRYMHGRRLSDGLHEAIEAIHGIPIEKGGAETQKISQQMFYELFPWVAGMSGTAVSSWKEFEDVYKLVAKSLPTNIQWRWLMGELERTEKPHSILDDNGEENFTIDEVIYTDSETGEQFFERLDLPHVLIGALKQEEVMKDQELKNALLMYNTALGRNKDNLLSRAKFTHYVGLVDETLDRIQKGQPILLHTVDPNVSMDLGKILEYEASQRGIELDVNVLYHGNHDNEAKIIAEAGKPNTITIATNMAGRGVDIKLTDESREAGGLHIIEAQSQTSARNSDQVKGRAARQGDPGSSIPILSTEDPYMGVYADRVLTVMQKLGYDSHILSEPKISKALDDVQQQIEERDAEYRENTLDYDKVLDVQRTNFLDKRQEILDISPDEMKEKVLELYSSFISDTINKAMKGDKIDYHIVAQHFSLAHSPFEAKGIADVLQDKTKRERLKKMYKQQLDDMVSIGFMDRHGVRQHLNEEEKDILLEKVEETLDNGRLPGRHAVPREYRTDMPIPLDGQLLGQARARMDTDQFISFMKKMYSASINSLVEQQAIPSEIGLQAYKDILQKLESQREVIEKKEPLHIPTAIPLTTREKVPVPYQYDCTFELQIEGLDEEKLYDTLVDHIQDAYASRGTPEEQLDSSRQGILKVMDTHWRDHLLDLESLKTQMRHPRMDPKQQYALDGGNLYNWMQDSIERTFAINYFRNVAPEQDKEE